MKKQLIGSLAFFLMTMLCFYLLSVRSVPRNHVELPVENGVVDATRVDFEHDIVALPPNCFTHYPAQLLQPGEQGGRQGEWTAAYGTGRVRVRLPQGSYALSQTAPDHALRLFADEQEIGALGRVGASPAESSAGAGCLIAGFSSQSTVVELTIQHSGFVRHYGMPTAYLGSAANISLQQQRLVLRDMLYAGGMLMAAMLFFGMFVFFGRKRQYLFFSLCCLCLTLYTLSTNSIPLALLWPMRAVTIARLEYLSMWGTAFSFFGYLSASFPGTFHKPMLRVGALLMGCIGLSILLLHPYQFTPLKTVYLACEAVFALYICVTILVRVRRPLAEQRLVLLAAMLLIVISVLEQAVLRYVLPYWYTNGLITQTAMSGMILLNMLALALFALRTERDLTQSRRAEQSLSEANQALDRLNQLQQEFLQTMSHELRTPLAVMSGHAQLSARKLRRGIDQEDILRRLDIVIRETGRLAELTGRLLEQSEQAGVKTKGCCDPKQVIRYCGKLYEPLLRKNNNRLEMSLSESIPAAGISSQNLTQVLLNLLANAARHTQNGSVELGAEPKGGAVRLWVRDTGEGMPQSLLAEVFVRQVQGENGGSKGLGLSISREIVEAAGGSIEIESAPGEGCCVHLSLPGKESAGKDGEEDDDESDHSLGGR